MEFSSIICSVEMLNFEVSSQDDRFDVMPRGLIELTSVFSSESSGPFPVWESNSKTRFFLSTSSNTSALH